MTTFHVDSSAVDTTAATARAAIARIQQDIAHLHGQLTGLDGAWTGPAANAFQAVVARWRGTQSRLETELTSLNEALAMAARQYTEMERAHVRMFQ